MSFLVGILTVLMIANCALLILLILVQLPKKDAGAGLAFGGGAADSLFGAGSGNALTKITKWSAGIFFVLALVLGSMESRLHNSGSASEFEKRVQQKQMQTQVAAPTASQPVLQQPAAAVPTNNLLSLPVTSNTNVPAK
jgi:preprotein translocase subunit SecG